MKWVDDGIHVFCPSCATLYHAQGSEPDFEKPGYDHCEMCGAEYFNTPEGILSRFRAKLDSAVTGTEIDDLRVGSLNKLLEWYHTHSNDYDLFKVSMEEILTS